MRRCLIWNPAQEAGFWQKQSSNRCFWQLSCVTGFSFCNLGQLFLTESLTEMLRHLILIRGIRKNQRCDTYNGGMILFSLHWYFHWILHLLKLHITINSAAWAFVWPQAFCIYLKYIIKEQDLQVVENFVTEGKTVGIIWTGEAFGMHCKPHPLYFAALNCVLIQTFRH